MWALLKTDHGELDMHEQSETIGTRMKATNGLMPKSLMQTIMASYEHSAKDMPGDVCLTMQCSTKVRI